MIFSLFVRYVIVMFLGLVLSSCTLSLKINDKLASLTIPTPQAILSSAIAANNNQTQWPVTVHFNTPIDGLDLSGFAVLNGTATQLVKVTDTEYTIVLVPTAEGNVSVQLNQDSVVNSVLVPNSASNLLQFYNDRTNPTATISYSGLDPTKDTPIVFTLTFSEPVDGQPQPGDFNVTGGTVSQVSGSGSVFAFEVVPSANGTVSVSYPAGKIMDLATNSNSASNSVSVAFNNDRPVPVLASTAGSDVNTAINVTVTFSAAVTGFTAADLEVENAVVSNFAGSGDSYSFTLAPIAEGNFRVRAVENAAVDAATNLSLASAWLQKRYDSVRPTVTLSSLPTYRTTAGSVSVTATFSEAVAGFDLSDLTLTNATASLSGSGTTYTITLTPSAEGTFGVSIPENAVSDTAGNGVQGPVAVSSILDTIQPTVVVTSDVGPYSYTSPMSFTVVFSEPVTGLDLSDFTVVGGTNAQLGTLVGFGTTWTFQMSPSGTGTKSITLPAIRVKDAAGLDNVVSNTETFIYDTTVIPVAFVQKEQVVSESAVGVQKFQVRLGGTKPYDVTINYRLVGNAVNGVDHDLPTEGSITIPANSANPTIVDIPFNLIHNPGSENKYMQMNLHYTSSPLVRFGVDYQSRLHISDTDSVHGSAIEMGMGNNSRCVIISNGRLRCWGSNSGDGTDDQVVLPKDIDSGHSYSKVATDSNTTTSCAIRINGDLYCWGSNSFYQLGNGTITASYSPTFVGSDFTDVAPIGRAVCGIKLGDIYCWGSETRGELANGAATSAVTTPTSMTSTHDFVAIAGGNWAGCALNSVGDLYCWGDDTSYLQGNGATTGEVLVPTLVPTAVKFKSLSMYASHACAIDVNDYLYCWGTNGSGNLGDGTTTNSDVPKAIDAGNKYLNVSVGNAHTCAVRMTSNQAVCWGSNRTGSSDAGALGDGSNYSVANKLVPTVVGGTSTYLKVKAGNNYACGITTDQRIKCWGSFASLSVGDGLVNLRDNPAMADSGQNYKQISFGSTLACGIDSFDRLKCWGNGTTASIGDGSSGVGVVRTSPIVLDRGLTFKMVAVGNMYGCAITTDDTVKCWGRNADGVLGFTGVSSSPTPRLVDGGAKYKKIVAGDSLTCGIRMDGVLKCWGYNSNMWQLGDGGVISGSWEPKVIDPGVRYRDIGVAPKATYHTCGVTEDKILKCWGSNNSYQAGLGSITPDRYNTPQVVSATDLYTSVSVGGDFACAIRDGSNSLYCWGNSAGYKTGLNSTTVKMIPTLVDDTAQYTSLRIGENGGCGFTNAGVKCWGDAYSSFARLIHRTSATRIPTLIPNATDYKDLSFNNVGTAVSGCLLKNDSTMWCLGPNTNGLLASASVFQSWLIPVDVTTWVVP
ncbi:Ig-like domain-containing protein [Bdellovibrio sp. HCB288]|uniref:Ig-like domain-containing protein n=1 Tax=Bdellovibrio sp. HCB288 TaxID=3394355 RepID=UPI0039B3A4B4